MSDAIIKVEGISKMYNLLQKKEEEEKLLIKSVFRRRSRDLEEFWALHDVSFEVKQGDKLGIIGRNGAGKSTLLKILSRIISPTKGRIEYEGRMASLLEVGTGFHPELTGRENIFLNGSILGMSRNEIKSKFDEIVEFAEVSRFLDTPVKRYSSGMYVRLAFAVAAHLEPEILIVDEVLAVGDAAFQKKCLGKMSEISKTGGKTILFVSHSMQAVQKLCNRAIFLEKGKLAGNGTVDEIVAKYLRSGGSGQSEYDIPEPKEPLKAQAMKVYIENHLGELFHEVPVGENWRVRCIFRVNERTEHFIFGLGIVSAFDQPVRTSWSEAEDIEPGDYEIVFDCGDLMLTTGTYRVLIGLSSNQRTFQYIDDLISVTISDAGDVAHNKRIVNTQSGLILNPMNINLKKISK